MNMSWDVNDEMLSVSSNSQQLFRTNQDPAAVTTEYTVKERTAFWPKWLPSEQKNWQALTFRNCPLYFGNRSKNQDSVKNQDAVNWADAETSLWHTNALICPLITAIGSPRRYLPLNYPFQTLSQTQYFLQLQLYTNVKYADTSSSTTPWENKL